MQEGLKPLSWCNQCGMHMPSSKIQKHRLMDKCNKAAERQLLQRDVEMATWCGEMEFSLEGEEGYEMVEGVATYS